MKSLILIVGILLLSTVFLAFTPHAATASTSGKRAGVWLAMSQTNGGGAGGDNFPTAQEFVNAYFNTGNVFSTAMFYVAVYNPDEITRTLQIASLVDSNPNIKLSIVMGFAFDSSADWAMVQSFIMQLKPHPSVGWVGIEGEHSTYGTGSPGSAGCEFGGNCYSIGQAWAYHTLSESQLESYFAQFDSMAANAGLSVVHYYVTFGSGIWQNSQPMVVVTQWPACNGSAPCAPLNTGIGDLNLCTSSNCIGISGGLSSNDYDAWNPSVNSGSYYQPWDNVIDTYIQVAAQYAGSTRSLVIFETGAYQFIDDWYRPIFVTDLANAMAQHPSGWILPGSSAPPQVTTTTTSTSSTATRTTASHSQTTTAVATSSTSVATTSTSAAATTASTSSTSVATTSTSAAATTASTSNVFTATTPSLSTTSSQTTSSTEVDEGDSHSHGGHNSPLSSTLGSGVAGPWVLMVVVLCLIPTIGKRRVPLGEFRTSRLRRT